MSNRRRFIRNNHGFIGGEISLLVALLGAVAVAFFILYQASEHDKLTAKNKQLVSEKAQLTTANSAYRAKILEPIIIPLENGDYIIVFSKEILKGTYMEKVQLYKHQTLRLTSHVSEGLWIEHEVAGISNNHFWFKIRKSNLEKGLKAFNLQIREGDGWRYIFNANQTGIASQ